MGAPLTARVTVTRVSGRRVLFATRVAMPAPGPGLAQGAAGGIGGIGAERSGAGDEALAPIGGNERASSSGGCCRGSGDSGGGGGEAGSAVHVGDPPVTVVDGEALALLS